MLLAQQLQSAGLGAFPCRADKGPAVPQGTDWKTQALLPPSEQQWHTSLVGVPIPPGSVVIDVDRYKGVTTDAIDRLLGCKLPWSEALIQHTQHGGEHYAFRVGWPVRQLSDALGLVGFDTRSGGKGYICTGEPGYTASGFGVFRLASLASLPCLPDAVRAKLEHVENLPPQTAPQTGTDLETVASALHHIDPGCSRPDWIKIGMALRTVTEDPTLFWQWSSGELTGAVEPANYNPDHIQWQWDSFKPTGGTTILSLYAEAVAGGWRSFDTAAAFGPGSVSSDTFDPTLDRILSSGCDPKQTGALISSIRTVGGSPIQRTILLAALTRELKDAGLLTKSVGQQLDALAGDTSQPRARGEYGKNHTENATLFLDRRYPNGGLTRSDQEWYLYNSCAWEQQSEEDVKHVLAVDMSPALPQQSNVSGTYGMLCALSHRSGVQINDIDPALILFRNGVLDLRTGLLTAHSPEHFTTNVLPYDYSPLIQAPRWDAFLNDIFEGDTERIELLQEWFGYMMSNSYEHHKILFMPGPARSGKGTIGRILEQIVGAHNFTGASLHSFASDPFINSLRTKSVAFSGDTERRVSPHSRDKVIERLKKISGNDAVEFERKWKSSLSQTLPTRITLAGNSIPSLFDDSGALASRMLVLPFEVSYLDHEDTKLIYPLLEELTGIAAWSLRGLQRLNVQGKFTEPAASLAEKQFMDESYSPLKQFIGAVCTLGGDHRTSCKDLYAAYRAWALLESETPLPSRKAFISAFKDATRGKKCRYGVHKMDGDPVRGFQGVTIIKVASLSDMAFKLSVAK